MLKAGGVIGIMGGGQLGRMTALAAANLGYRTHIYTDENACPAAQVTPLVTVAKYTDEAALAKFAASVDVVTFEFENIPHSAVEALSKIKPVHPGWQVLYTAQNRLREKDLATKLGFGTAPYRKVASLAELEKAFDEIGGNGAILKTAELGYDGKGQARLKAKADCKTAWAELGTSECVLEGFVSFEREISVIIARNVQGQVAVYEPAENRHEGGILRTTILPAAVSSETAKKAEAIARAMAEELKLVGLLAIEFFVTPEGDVLVNEMAPRPHNSGHWTMDACATSQFEQFARAVAGLPLGSTERLCKVRMENLIGDDVKKVPDYLKNPNAKLHLYGKADVKPGRKMGHVNILAD